MTQYNSPVLVTTNPTRRPGSWRILRASPACGGRYAWARVRPSGALEIVGCVCHGAGPVAGSLTIKGELT